MKTLPVYIILLGIALSSPIGALADTGFSTSVMLRQDALAAGYTVVNPVGTMWVGLPADATSGTKQLRVKLNKVAHPENYYGDEQPVSDLYRYHLKANNDFKLDQHLWLQLSFPSSYSDDELVLKYYDSASDRWRKVSEQETDTISLVQSGQLKKKHAIIALFEKPSADHIVQGIASWYYGSGSACNSFPMGSRIRVTNVATGASVDSTIVSTGPFVPGRVVDLNHDDFAAIASISAGVVEVTVEAIP